MHEQGLVVGAQIVANRAVLGERALEAEVVAMTGVVEDHHRTTETSHVKQRPCPQQQGGRRAVGRRRRQTHALPGEEIREQLAFRRHGLGINPGHGRADQVRDVRQRHEPPGQDLGEKLRRLKLDAQVVAFLEQITEQRPAALRILADPQPAQAVDEQAPGHEAEHGTAEAGADHRIGAVVALPGEHERESRQEAISCPDGQVVVDGKLV